MKIFSADQIKKWDLFTIQNEPIESINLMEKAANACCTWIENHVATDKCFNVFCGRGNNGGDGLAIARILINRKVAVNVFIAGNGSGSADFQTNLVRLEKLKIKIHFLENENDFPHIKEGEPVVDALFGTGLNKKPAGLLAALIRHINASNARVISIDIPSGMYVAKTSLGNDIIGAAYTLSFQNQKLAFLAAENASYFGNVILLNIDLSTEFEKDEDATFLLVDEEVIKKIYRPRQSFSNKGNYGYACMLAGSYGMMGAAVLSSWACLRSGVGKLTSFICEAGYNIFQTAVPEAMCKTFGKKYLTSPTGYADFDAIGVGPGLGKHNSHKELLRQLFAGFKKPIVIDADALNMLSKEPQLYASIPPKSILTPHPKEFERLFGKTASDFQMWQLAMQKAGELNVIIVLKGHHTLIATPANHGYFNSTGNAGMATGGAGDVLTGIITGLVAQKYDPVDACILGVYLHGLAGDIAAQKISQEALVAKDIADNLGNAFLGVSQLNA